MRGFCESIYAASSLRAATPPFWGLARRHIIEMLTRAKISPDAIAAGTQISIMPGDDIRYAARTYRHRKGSAALYGHAIAWHAAITARISQMTPLR